MGRHIELPRRAALHCALAAFCLAGNATCAILSDPVKNSGHALLTKHIEAVGVIEAIAVIWPKGKKSDNALHELRSGSTAIIVSRDGLVVSSWSALNPQIQFAGGTRSMESVVTQEVEFKEIYLRGNDGSRTPMKVVRDEPEYDVVLLAAEKAEKTPDKQFAYVEIQNADVAEAVMLEEYISIGRAPPVFGYVPIARVGRMQGIVEMPKRCYLLDEPILGGVVFALDGRVLGISLRRIIDGRPQNSVVLPVMTLAALLKQTASNSK